jgi:hypothetical protein
MVLGKHTVNLAHSQPQRAFQQLNYLMFVAQQLHQQTTQLACSTVPGATNYIWEFTNTATSQVYTIYRGNNMNNFYLYMLPSAPAGNYDVVIRAVFGSTIGPAGPTCNISFLTNSGRYAAPDQLENGEEKFSVNLFPNPSNGQFEITSENIENLEVEILMHLEK